MRVGKDKARACALAFLGVATVGLLVVATAWAENGKAAAGKAEAAAVPKGSKGAAEQVRPQVIQVWPAEVKQHDKIREKLAMPVNLEQMTSRRDDVALDDIAEMLSATSAVPVVVDVARLDELGIGSDAPVPAVPRGDVAFGLALTRVLRGIDPELCWVVRDEVVMITTLEAREEMLTTKTYDVADLVRCDSCGTSGETLTDFDGLIEVINTSLAPDTWDVAGGAASAAEIEGPGFAVLVVSQVSEVHDAIKSLLSGLRQVRHASGVGCAYQDAFDCCGDVAGGLDNRSPEQVKAEAEKWTAEAKAAAAAVKRPQPKQAVMVSPLEVADMNRAAKTLKKRIDVEKLSGETSVGELAEAVSKAIGVPVAFDAVALDELSIGADMPLEFELSGSLEAGALLRYALNKINPELDVLVEPGRLLITTRERVSENPVIKVYDVADLTIRCVGNRGNLASDFESLIEPITTTLEPDSWEEAGGYGRIVDFGADGIRSIIVSTTWQQHEQVANLLAALRNQQRASVSLPPCDLPPHLGPEAQRDGDKKDAQEEKSEDMVVHARDLRKWKGAELKAEPEPVAIPKPQATQDISPRNSKIRAKLIAALDVKVDLSRLDDDSSLGDVVDWISQELNVPVVVDGAALDELSIGTDSPVSTEVSGDFSARSALRLLLGRIDRELTYMVRSEMIWVTTKERELEQLIVKSYDVFDLCACQRKDGSLIADFDPLIEAVTSTIARDTWEEAGGTASIQEYEKSGTGSLIIAAPLPIHRQVDRLLESLRTNRDESANCPACLPYAGEGGFNGTQDAEFSSTPQQTDDEVEDSIGIEGEQASGFGRGFRNFGGGGRGDPRGIGLGGF